MVSKFYNQYFISKFKSKIIIMTLLGISARELTCPRVYSMRKIFLLFLFVAILVNLGFIYYTENSSATVFAFRNLYNSLIPDRFHLEANSFISGPVNYSEINFTDTLIATKDLRPNPPLNNSDTNYNRTMNSTLVIRPIPSINPDYTKCERLIKGESSEIELAINSPYKGNVFL